MRRIAFHLLIAFATLAFGVASSAIWKGRSFRIYPNVVLYCPEGQCQSISPDDLDVSPKILLESQPNAPVQLHFESTANADTYIGFLTLKNVSSKPVRSYWVKYAVSGNSWRHEYFAIASLSPSFSRPPGALIQPNEVRPILSSQVRVPANSQVTLRIYQIEFADGTIWRNEE
jgi:hypothetical protein